MTFLARNPWLRWIPVSLLAGTLLFTARAQTSPSPAFTGPAPAAARPVELWAFRSVLDGTPRVLTLALHADLYVAYDTYYGGLTKIWKEGVLKQGAVFNQKHGPQPVSKGGKYMEYPYKAPAFVCLGKNNPLIPKPVKLQFAGYRFEKGKVALRYDLELDSLVKAELEEWPEYVDGISGPKLERVFSWRTPPPQGYTVMAEIAADGLAHPQNSLQTNGDWKVLTRSEKLALSKPIWSLVGLLKLAPTAPTFITVLLDPAARL